MSRTNFPSSALQIRPASFNDIPYIKKIAEQTWPIAYREILQPEQLSYMLNLFYSSESLQQQIKDHHHFLLALKDYSPIGFASFSHKEAQKFKLQKLYVLPTIQKSGAGRKLLETVEDIVKSMNGKIIQLNVNRSNTARLFYEQNGYVIIKEEDVDIGNNYYMNDFVMEKKLD